MLEIMAVDHVGFRVADAARSEAFYAQLGFAVTYRSLPHAVVILRNEAGVELNLVVNAERRLEGANVLMDIPDKYAGITHVALRVRSLEQTVQALQAAGVEITEGPVTLGSGRSVFVRDPDRNVLELREPSQ